jgi:hypothetical protein
MIRRLASFSLSEVDILLSKRMPRPCLIMPTGRLSPRHTGSEAQVTPDSVDRTGTGNRVGNVHMQLGVIVGCLFPPLQTTIGFSMGAIRSEDGKVTQGQRCLNIIRSIPLPKSTPSQTLSVLRLYYKKDGVQKKGLAR